LEFLHMLICVFYILGNDWHSLFAFLRNGCARND
jgi:hypothetical protein